MREAKFAKLWEDVRDFVEDPEWRDRSYLNMNMAISRSGFRVVDTDETTPQSPLATLASLEQGLASLRVHLENPPEQPGPQFQLEDAIEALRKAAGTSASDNG